MISFFIVATPWMIKFTLLCERTAGFEIAISAIAALRFLIRKINGMTKEKCYDTKLKSGVLRGKPTR